MKSILFFLGFFVASVSCFAAYPQQTQPFTRATPSRMSSFDDELETAPSSNSNIESAWRFAKKPFLRIGGKGISETHCNSLIELLNAHTVVKVKFNTQQFGSLENAFEAMKELTEKTGKMKNIELIQFRNSENVVMFGIPGAMGLILEGSFPPAPEEEASEEASES